MAELGGRRGERRPRKANSRRVAREMRRVPPKWVPSRALPKKIKRQEALHLDMFTSPTCGFDRNC